MRDKYGTYRLRYGEFEIRTDSKYPEPFPLYPGETLKKIDSQTIVPRNSALKIRANREFTDADSKKRLAGEEWMIPGPWIYVPRIEEDKVQVINPIIIEKNKAIKLRAKLTCNDKYGKKREAGEEWLVREEGQYLLNINEIMVETVSAIILTDKIGVHLTATRTFVDVYNKNRKAGEEWLITKQDAPVHICDVYEKVLSLVNIVVLRKDQYCYLENPLVDGVNQMGKKKLILGPNCFFLNPGEKLDGGIKENYILAEDEALLMRALEEFTDQTKVKRKAGQTWMVVGPCNYIPPVEVGIVAKRKRIPLDKIEGIYVRNYDTGEVHSIIGKSYLVQANEELAKKDVPEVVEKLLAQQGNIKKREPHSVVSFKVPYNAVVQVYDYKKKVSRVIVGPNLVMLEPDEQFTVNYLSGGTPKVPGKIISLYITLGPTFSTDLISQIETSDHARLELKLSYNWKFDVPDMEHNSGRIFNVRDFVGDMCSCCASRVRAMIASMPFDSFHKSSARTIRKAILGFNPDTDKVNEKLVFDSNGLIVFNVDIQSAEPIDQKTKVSLQKTVTQAIEITTKMQEQEARRQADKIEQEETGKLERLILENSSSVEEAKKSFLGLQADSEAVKSKGQAIAEAKAKVTAAEIAANADVTYADYQAKAKKIREKAEIEHGKLVNALELEHKTAMSKLKVEKAEQLGLIEGTKFKKIMEAIGKDTLVEISSAGPEMQGKMLEGLGLQGYMLMDSENPINLFTAAQGMIGNKTNEQK